ncbi:MAG: DUF177 domain-containing protein [Chlorobium sp.]|jgi:uncharacterized protein|nr:DUF177 domain-containing protein [Chlorobium sp.]
MHKEKSRIEIGLGVLVDGANEFNFTCKASDFEGRELTDAGFTRDIEVNAVAEKSEDEITITINTSTLADFTCDICLAPVSKELTGSLVLSYLFGIAVDNKNEGSDDYKRIERGAESIDITAEVCETLLLSLPMKVTCTGNPDCKLYGSEQSMKENEEPQPGNKTPWQESLEKLKSKYR